MPSTKRHRHLFKQPTKRAANAADKIANPTSASVKRGLCSLNKHQQACRLLIDIDRAAHRHHHYRHLSTTEIQSTRPSTSTSSKPRLHAIDIPPSTTCMRATQPYIAFDTDATDICGVDSLSLSTLSPPSEGRSHRATTPPTSTRRHQNKGADADTSSHQNHLHAIVGN